MLYGGMNSQPLVFVSKFRGTSVLVKLHRLQSFDVVAPTTVLREESVSSKLFFIMLKCPFPVTSRNSSFGRILKRAIVLHLKIAKNSRFTSFFWMDCGFLGQILSFTIVLHFGNCKNSHFIRIF